MSNYITRSLSSKQSGTGIRTDIQYSMSRVSSIQRGGGGIMGGGKGKGHQGTCIKDTWGKPKGVGSRVGGGVSGGGIMETTVLEQQCIYFLKMRWWGSKLEK